MPSSAADIIKHAHKLGERRKAHVCPLCGNRTRKLNEFVSCSSSDCALSLQFMKESTWVDLVLQLGVRAPLLIKSAPKCLLYGYTYEDGEFEVDTENVTSSLSFTRSEEELLLGVVGLSDVLLGTPAGLSMLNPRLQDSSTAAGTESSFADGIFLNENAVKKKQPQKPYEPPEDPWAARLETVIDSEE